MALPQTAFFPNADTFSTTGINYIKHQGTDMAGKGYRYYSQTNGRSFPSRMRLQETRLVPPIGFVSTTPLEVNSSGFPMPSIKLNDNVGPAVDSKKQRDFYIPATASPIGNSYYQRYRDATLQNRLDTLEDSLLQSVQNAGVQSHFGRCGSGWRNVTAYKDYGGHNCLFVDGSVSDRDQLFKRVKQQYLKAHLHSVWPEPKPVNENYDTWPDSNLHDARSPLLGETFGVQPPEKRPEFMLRADRGHAIHTPVSEQRNQENGNDTEGAYVIDMNRVPSAGLRSGRPRTSRSRYTWRVTTEM